jgi:predicted metal-dependent HD superfamily phosphohydrolase
MTDPGAIAQAPHLEGWCSAWSGLGVREPDATLLEQLQRCYAEPHRHYHTVQHLAECFIQFALLHDIAEQPAQIALALWFHDAIYDTHRDDNELCSAEWARASLLAAGVSSQAAEQVHALVMVTRHDAMPATLDERIVVDVDLSILGADAQRFDEYECQVRAEYAWVEESMFRSRRRSILEAFLARPQLYHTPRFIALCEARARGNLRRSIDALGSGP